MIMISTSPPSALHLTAEEANLFDLWHACGLGVVLEKAGSIDPILLIIYGMALSRNMGLRTASAIHTLHW